MTISTRTAILAVATANVFASLPKLTAQEPTAPTAAEVRAVLEPMVGRSCPALCLAIVRGESVLFADSVGTARIKRPALVADRDSRFPLGDISRVVADLLVERMVEAEVLDLDIPIDDFVGFEVPSDDGTELATLDDLLRGTVRTDHYLNNLPFGALDRWPLKGALRDHLRVKTQHGSRAQLAYAVLQAAVEQVGGTTYGDLVRKFVSGPLGMDGWIPAAREGDPQNVDLHVKGFLGLPKRESTHYSNLHAAQGGWLTADDAAALAREFLRIAKERGVKTHGDDAPLAFASFFDSTQGQRPHLASIADLNGSHGRIEIYPDAGIGIVMITNSVGAQPFELLEPVRALVLPTPDVEDDDNQWNSAVGLGGGAGGMIDRQNRVGRWRCELAVRDRKLTLDLEIAKRRLCSFSVDGGEIQSARVRLSGVRKFYFEIEEGIVPLRQDIPVNGSLKLELSEDDAELSGELWLGSRYSSMTFWPKFTRVE